MAPINDKNINFAAKKRWVMKKMLLLIGVLICLLSCQTAEREYIPPSSMNVSSRLSNQIVRCFAEDTLGYIWIGTDRGLNRYDGYSFKHYYSNKEDSTSLITNGVGSLLCDSQGRLWIGTTGGLCRWIGEDSFEQINIDLRYKNINQILETPDHRILINLIEHLVEYIPETGELKVLIEDFDPEKSYINICHIDNMGRLWSKTRNHERCFNTHTLELMEQRDWQWDETSMRSVNEITFIDSRHNEWKATSNHGFTKTSLIDTRGNSHWAIKDQLAGHRIASLNTPDGKRIWVATFDNELFLIDAQTDKIVSINTHGLIEPQRNNSISLHVTEDRQGRLWIINNDKLKEYRYIPDGSIKVEDDHPEIKENVASITESTDGIIWAGTNTNKLYRLRPGEQSFTSINFDATSMYVAFQITALPDGNLVMGSAFNNPLHFDTSTGEVYRIPLIENISDYSLTTALTVDEDGSLWIGTLGLGAFKYNLSTLEISHVEGMECEEIADIIADDEGNIWISTHEGLSLVDRESMKVKNNLANDANTGDQYTQGCIAKLYDGMLLFGGENGITCINPSATKIINHSAISFDNLKTHNSMARLNASNGISLNPTEKDFSIIFSMPDFGDHTSTRFCYQLKGYNEEWIDIGNNREIYFSNVPSGTYLLTVMAREHDPEVVLAESNLKVVILTSWWNTWWAWTIYLFIVLCISLIIYRSRRLLAQEKKAAESLRIEKEHERKIKEMNANYFSSISHELRTPLTMITGPSKQLADSEFVDRQDKQLATTISLNAERMLRLVNQLMDAGKLEHGSLKLHVRQTELTKLLAEAVALIKPGVSEKHITMSLNGMERPILAMVDEDKLEKVLVNLLSNALKYTPQHGIISCGIENDEERITLWVEDNGKSIPEDQIEKIFEQFYQVGDLPNYGTGIGLYFARKLMSLHHGEVTAKNIPEGGVRFIVKLPAKDIYTPEEHVKTEVKNKVNPPFEAIEHEVKEENKMHTHTLLLVDDDTVVISYLKQLFSSNYNLRLAYDGASALEEVMHEMPDLVISDVAMPGMDGYQLCQALKEDLGTCHIPIVLLTAKSTIPEQIIGIETGADAYVTKPFDPDYLLAMVKTQIANRERIKRILGESVKAEAAVKEGGLNTQDKLFMDELFAIMEQELSNPELNVEALTTKLLMSRSKLYYKIKGLTGDTPAGFFKKYKLNKAAKMLKSGEHSISEVSDLTGFSSPTLFSRNFKQQFGVTPSEYIK